MCGINRKGIKRIGFCLDTFLDTLPQPATPHSENNKPGGGGEINAEPPKFIPES